MAAPVFLVPSDPLTPRLPDEHYVREASAAQDVGLTVAVVDHDAIARGDLREALRRVPDSDGEEAGAVRTAGGGPVGGPGVVKDYVKSRTHEWDEACFVPDLADTETATRVIARMVELQGDDLAGGIVVRAFEQFAPDDGERGKEVRVWWVGGAPALVTPHPDADAGGAAYVPAEVIDAVGASVRALGAPFVTTDLALRTDGVWRLIEVGDGQVSDLPGGQEPGVLVEALAGVSLLCPA